MGNHMNIQDTQHTLQFENDSVCACVCVHMCASANHPRPTAEELQARGSMSDFNYLDIWCMTNTAECASSTASLNNRGQIHDPETSKWEIKSIQCDLHLKS